MGDLNAISWSSNRSGGRPPWAEPPRSSSLAPKAGDGATPEHEHAWESEGQHGEDALALHYCEVNTASWSSRGSKAPGLPWYVNHMSSVDREATELSAGEVANDADLNLCEVNTASWSSVLSNCGRYPRSMDGRHVQHSTFRSVQEVIAEFSMGAAKLESSSGQPSPGGSERAEHVPSKMPSPSQPDDLPKRREDNLRWRLWAARQSVGDAQDVLGAVASQLSPPLEVLASPPVTSAHCEAGCEATDTGLREAQSCGTLQHLAEAAEGHGPREVPALEAAGTAGDGGAAPVVTGLAPVLPVGAGEELVLVAIPKSRLEAVARLLGTPI